MPEPESRWDGFALAVVLVLAAICVFAQLCQSP